jgi:hypothetical protein
MSNSARAIGKEFVVTIKEWWPSSSRRGAHFFVPGRV